MERLQLSHPAGTTTILAGTDALSFAVAPVRSWLADRRVFTLSSPEVRALHGGRLDVLTETATSRVDLDVPDGEQAKRLRVAERLWETMAASEGKRDSCLITLGGGSVGDLGGFVAAAFLRGIEFIHIPTTLLAQVDASIGGKTAVDLDAGKNLVGLFRHPQMVVADPAVLETLPPRLVRDGLVEVLKIALAFDPELFELLESRAEVLKGSDPMALHEIVPRAIAAKIRVVEADPEEAGLRRILNLGHTLGHALESAGGYRSLLHGEAVAWGIRFALGLAGSRGADPEMRRRVEALLRVLTLPPLPEVSARELMDLMLRDKKTRERGLVWVLPTEVGRVEIVADLEFAQVKEALDRFLDGESEPGE